MKQKNTILSTLAPALLLLAATLCVAGCSQTDDAPAGAALAARGGEPLHIRIAPKPGYTDADPSTRSKVDGATGKFSWEVDDLVDYHITFNDAAGTTIKQTFRYDESGKWVNHFAKWDGEPANDVVWPMGASSATVLAFYSDSRKDASDKENAVLIADTQENGKGLHAVYSGTLSFGNVLDIKLKHATTRFEFTGLEPNTAYTISTATYFKQWHVENGFQNGVDASFTTDASGNAITYGHIDSFAVDGLFNIALQKAGTTVDIISVKAQGTAGDWKTNGYIYKINMKKGGSVNPDNSEDLITPSYKGMKPNLLAISGKDAYWVAPEDAMDEWFEWTEIDFATVCPDGWHVPSQEEFTAMTGFPADHNAKHTENIDAILAAFPLNDNVAVSYWSSTIYFDGDKEAGAWKLSVDLDSGGLQWMSFMRGGRVRCVRQK